MSIMIQFLRKFDNDEDLEHNSLKPIYYRIAGFFLRGQNSCEVCIQACLVKIF